jgi:hypothetical protein
VPARDDATVPAVSYNTSVAARTIGQFSTGQRFVRATTKIEPGVRIIPSLEPEAGVRDAPSIRWRTASTSAPSA